MKTIEFKTKEERKEYFKEMLSKSMIEAQWKYCQEDYKESYHSLDWAKYYCNELIELEKE